MSRRAAPGATVGLDVGGANLKYALVGGPDAAGRKRRRGSGDRASLLRTGSLPLALWREPDALPATLEEVRRAVSGEGAHPGGSSAGPVARVALTMTGELADAFPRREDGVRHIVRAVRRVWPDAELRVLARDGGWRAAQEARDDPLAVAAANWQATGRYLAVRRRRVLLADMGSTTTDLVPVLDGSVGSGAVTDLQRLQSGELVYTGLLRTPLCAMVDRVELEGGAVDVAGEVFAVAADVHLWLGSLSPEGYACETPDGGPATREGAARRLARAVCSDPDELGGDGLRAVARAAADAQARRIRRAVERQRRTHGPGFPERACVTGAGADLLAAVLRRAGLEPADPPAALSGRHAPAATAAAAALLLADRP